MERAAKTIAAASPTVLLARRAAAGDTAATVTLVRELAPSIARWVRIVLGASHPDVDDAVQRALLGFVRALPAYRGDSEPAAYARIIAVRAALAERRRAGRERARHTSGIDLDSLEHPQLDLPSTRTRMVRAVLAEIPPEQAEALALRVVLGLSLEEIARATGVPSNTVRSRIRLAKQRLAARLSP